MFGDPQTELPPLYLEEQPAQKSQPNLGWTILFGALYFGVLPIVFFLLFFLMGYLLHQMPLDVAHHIDKMPKWITVYTSIASALATVLIAWPAFGYIWERPFWQVLQLNWQTARVRIFQLLFTGLILSIAAQSLESLMTLPKEMPIQGFFQAKNVLWALTFYGVLIAPLAEETLFRGLLLPAIARAIDWFRRAPVPVELEWRDGISKSSLAISAVLTSIGFGCMHAAQLGFAWNAVALLSAVGLGLAYVRIRYNSLACSMLVHAAYNGSIFFALLTATRGYTHLDLLTKK